VGQKAAKVAPGTNPDVVAAALRSCLRAFWSVVLYSAAVNVLILAGPLYMFQIYDRVLGSRSVPTLVALTIVLCGAYAFLGAFDLIRSRIIVRAAVLLDRHLSTTVHGAVLRIAVQNANASEAHQPMRDLDQIRAFLVSPGPTAIIDLPWMPAFLAICYLIHPWLGLLSLAGALLLLSLTILNERASRAPARALAQDVGTRWTRLEAGRRNCETVVAMGMAGELAKRWMDVNDRFLTAVVRSTEVVGSYSSISKVLRLLLQSAILGLGAYLVIKQELTPGSMIAASIMMARALAPIETAIANWRGFISARQSIHRLSRVLARLRSDRTATQLPKPVRSLDVEQIIVAPPGARTPILTKVRFRLTAGEALGIIGPSGSGKTSLARTLIGIWPAAKGNVRLDGAALDQWDPEFLGRQVGYVAQNVELFDGTIAENIARMSVEPNAAAILEAARAAGAHDLILRLSSGYETKIGDAGTVLSGGQRQRIALARALYGSPFLVVLDEPNSNLDREGEIALQQAVRDLKARGAIVVLIAHRSATLAQCDKVLFLAKGVQQAFGPRDEILRKVLAPPVSPAVTAGHLKVVSEATEGGER
jgi:ATP-binding cassette, subfamily C, type I secretion system permease/ATPase